ncbi:MAG: HEPN domain-containing protein [Deltaproteobacteria bacterium]|nr:HEPN domain-containing protein [Deltaproteobacteria bacterium]
MIYKTAILLHILDWDLNSTDVDVGFGIQFGKFEDSNVERLYLQLCREQYIDQGDPYNYKVYFAHANETSGEYDGPYSETSQICNLLTLALGAPLGMCREISSKDDFKTPHLSQIIYKYNHFQEHLNWDAELVVNAGTVEILKAIINNFKKLNPARSLIFNAVSNFFYAWRSNYDEQACIYLAIALEALLSPNSNTELSHRIAHNACRFLGNDRKEREEIYKITKAFYNLRSKLIHGSITNYDQIMEISPKIYAIVNKILVKILLDGQLIETFDDTKKRGQFFNRWLFE